MRNKFYRMKITKAHYYRLGAFANPRLFRQANARGAYSYYMRMD